ncbi:MAG: PIG-L family deacetylase, partial [Spirochaetales bacterium]|nr:PIG-L family deacetylase [Spirochaetales bacterium]
MRPRARLIFLTVLFILAGCATPMPGENCQSREEDPPSSAIIPGPEVRAADISSGKATGSELPAAAEQRNEAAGPLVIEPGSPIPDFDLDILFIHAHPDDESLDYASLLALADETGMTTGLLIFTDGESGLDTYPDRPVTPDLYPDHYLKGEELSAVRSGELVRASAILGVDLLIRLGLRNSPYNTWLDERPVDEVMALWGGEEYLGKTLRDILKKTSPETVVSPEKPGKTLEHFEHEAVGYLVEKVLTEGT